MFWLFLSIYYVLVASEGNDTIALVSFDPATGAKVERVHRIGTNPTELLGPHGITVSPDGQYYYVSTAHGAPNGALLKYSTKDDALLGHVTLGLFPATAHVTKDGNYVWVVNFNLYGGHVPSSVSVVYTDGMAEIKRIETCMMPHGSRLSADGLRHYSACMMEDRLVEIDTQKMEVARTLYLPKGCAPTWAQPDNAVVWVACSKSNVVAEVDLASWEIKRSIPAGNGIYNLAVSGALVVGTNKRDQSTWIFDKKTGTATNVKNSRRVPSGLVISADGRYAFITLEGVGSEPGTVDVIDLAAKKVVASVDVGQQAGGIDLLPE